MSGKGRYFYLRGNNLLPRIINILTMFTLHLLYIYLLLLQFTFTIYQQRGVATFHLRGNKLFASYGDVYVKTTPHYFSILHFHSTITFPFPKLMAATFHFKILL